MATGLKRMTFVITPDMEPLLDEMKKERFYNCSQSEMIRKLIGLGLKAMKDEKGNKQSRHEKTA